jgi:hypothetical protein
MAFSLYPCARKRGEIGKTPNPGKGLAPSALSGRANYSQAFFLMCYTDAVREWPIL